jgi:dolichyl-phosphate-mannose--protein O-mannosyl transferase
MLERCSGMVNNQELPEQRSGVQKMSSSVVRNLTYADNWFAHFGICRFLYVHYSPNHLSV